MLTAMRLCGNTMTVKASPSPHCESRGLPKIGDFPMILTSPVAHHRSGYEILPKPVQEIHPPKPLSVDCVRSGHDKPSAFRVESCGIRRKEGKQHDAKPTGRLRRAEQDVWSLCWAGSCLPPKLTIGLSSTKTLGV